MAVPSTDDLRAAFAYDRDAGIFTWRISPRYRVEVGSVAGSFSAKGYRYLQLHGTALRASRVAWLFEHGAWPADGVEVDHIDGDRANDRIANLRLATTRQNCQNRGRSRANTTGIKGVSLKEGRYVARISTPQKRLYLGAFATPEEAQAAYTKAALHYHGEFARPA